MIDKNDSNKRLNTRKVNELVKTGNKILNILYILFIILLVFFEISIAQSILSIESVITTISDASIAEPEPTPPIDIPTSALASTGESFIPSPTNATFPFVPLYFSNSFSSSENIRFSR